MVKTCNDGCLATAWEWILHFVVQELDWTIIFYTTNVLMTVLLCMCE